MAHIPVRNPDDAAVERPHARAASSGASLEAELAAIRAMTPMVTGRRLGEELIREGRDER